MALVPFSYNARSLVVRRAGTAITVLGIGATVAVLAGVLALENGFRSLFSESGREDIVVILRPGAGSEGESMFQRERVQVIVKSSPEIAVDAAGLPMAAAESFLAVRRFKLDGGEVNVPVRGVQPMSFTLAGDALRIRAGGRNFAPGSDEVIVGAKLAGRIRDCAIGEVIVFNTTPFRVVGVFDHDGPFASEVWGDAERMAEALERPGFNRIIARLRHDASADAFAERLDADKQAPAKALTERKYLAGQTLALSVVFTALGVFLAVIMGIAAVFTATNTMLSVVAARTHEIGILKSIGFRPAAIFLAFLFESVLLGLAGGVIGALLALPLNGVETGAMNWNTFTEVAFAFRVTPSVLVKAALFSLVLGLAGGAWPAWKAAGMTPTEALRRR